VRPVKAPAKAALKRLDVFKWIEQEALAILKKHKAPRTWGEKEVALICKFMLHPYMFDAVSDSERKDRKDRASKIILQYKTDYALQWAKLWADAPKTMIEALPKIESLADAFFSGKVISPRKRDIHSYRLQGYCPLYL
jgi:hypothetical protein